MIPFKRLLTKSSKSPDHPQEREMLSYHLQDVVETAQVLVGVVGHQSLKSLGLEDVFDCEALSAAVVRGAFTHDLGKANNQFQRMVRHGPRLPQALRHEWISAWLLLTCPELDHWLFAGCSLLTRHAALFAALGHHLKVEDGATVSDRGGSGDVKVAVLCDHSDFRASLQVACNSLGLPAPPLLQRVEIDLLSRPLAELRKWLMEALGWYKKTDANTQRFIALAKALVIAADVAGSALPKEGMNPGKWAQEVLGRVCAEKDLRDIATTRLGPYRPRPFQRQVEESKGRVTFVKAGCGSGKTAAAYLWAAHRAAGRKLFSAIPRPALPPKGIMITSSPPR